MKVSLKLYGLVGSALLVASVASVAGMTSPNSPEPPKGKLGKHLKIASKEEAAIYSLADEIQRRFHDRNDVDFGFSRVIRPDRRLHVSPFAPKPFGRFQHRPSMPLRAAPVMLAENDAEKQSLDILSLSRKLDVAIYTFGRFGLEASDLPARVKGPGYVRGDALDFGNAPEGIAFVESVRKAWATGAKEVVLSDRNGWHLLAQRVEADGQDCLGCHGAAGEGNLKNVGDSVGMLVIAVRERRVR